MFPALGTASDLLTLLNTDFFEVCGLSFNGNVVDVASLSDFPPADINDEIHLLADTAYFIKGHIDLTDKILVCDGICAIFGSSSETSSLTTTNVNPMISSAFTLPIQNISLTAPIALALSGALSAFDFIAVNFVDCAQIGTVNGCTNFVYDTGAFLNSGGLVFDGTIGTVAFNNSLFDTATATTAISIAATATITRRFRIIYSSFVTLAGETSLDVDPLSNTPDEAYILDTVNFSGGGTYLTGLDHTSNKTLFTACVGIINTSVNGQIYMNNNAVATVIPVVSTFYKVAGVTTASADNAKYTATDNRLTNDSVIERKYVIFCSLSFTSGNNNVCEFGFFDSKIGIVRVPSRTKSTANAAGRAENISFMCVVQHGQGDYIEIWASNTSNTTNITVTDMNFVITEIK